MNKVQENSLTQYNAQSSETFTYRLYLYLVMQSVFGIVESTLDRKQTEHTRSSGM
jgi:hypothetical protein